MAERLVYLPTMCRQRLGWQAAERLCISLPSVASVAERLCVCSLGVASVSAGKQLSVRREQSQLESEVGALLQARNRMKTARLTTTHNLMRRAEQAAILADNGGSPGEHRPH